MKTFSLKVDRLTNEEYWEVYLRGQQLLSAVAAGDPQPVVLALSNPTSKCECQRRSSRGSRLGARAPA